MEFRLLGSVEVVQAGRALTLGGRRQRAVLTHLLLHRGTPVASDWLIEQVWAAHAPPAVRASLHTYVSRLRSQLGADRLETRSQGYLLHAVDDEVDTARFEQKVALARSLRADDTVTAAAVYDDALALRRGPALGDLADEPSLQAEASRIDGVVDAVRREVIGVRLRLGRHAEVVPELEAMVRHDPLQEDLQADLVLALYRCGRQADALAAYEHARRLLADELGVEPSAPLRRLHEQVLRQDPALLAGASALRGFRLLEVLGEGTSAVVHRAVQPHTGREVALKALHPWLADDPQLVRQFAAAAEAAMTLEHPNVVPLHDSWREPGGAYLAMRLMRGGNLADRLERGPLEAAAVVRLVEQVAAAQAALRAQGRDHEQLRVDDVLLDEHDNAYLSGFRLAAQPLPVAAAGRDADRTLDAAGALVHVLSALLERLPEPPPAAVALAERARAAGSFPGAEELCGALRAALLPALPAQRAVRVQTPRRNPYKGLRAFGEADSGDFFGRTDLVDRLVARLCQADRSGPRRFLAVVGPSGSGKSSLVRAGLVPALRAGAVGGLAGWYVAELVPGTDPFAELVCALRRIAVRPLDDAAGSRLRDDPATLSDLVAQVLPDADSELLLVVDQFEELFTLVGDAERQAFLTALVRVCVPGSQVRVVVTLRADFYDRPLADPELAALLQHGTEVVVPLSAEDLEQVVVEPAARAGLSVEPALLAQVVADMASTSTALPLLQYALTELVDRRRSDTLTLTGYRELGGVGGALVRRADATYRELSPDRQRVARQILLQLVHPDESGADTRRRVLQSELEHRTGDPVAARQVLAVLGAARLVAFDRDPTTRAPTVEVAHEALLREWALLGGWLDAARDDLRTERRLTTAAVEWDGSDRDPSFLATGSRLESLERWSVRWALASGWTPTALERCYLDESLAARDLTEQDEQQRRVHERELERRSVRRLRAVAAVLAVAVVGVSTLTVYGFAQRDRAERESLVARARALAAAAAADDTERGVLLALEAVRITREADGTVLAEAEEALHNAVMASRVLLTLPGVGGAVDWSAGGLVVTEDPEDTGLVVLRDEASGEVVRSFPGHDVDLNDVAFSPDGTRLLSTGDDGAARLWDPATGRLLWEHVATGHVWAPTFSGDGTRVAASWEQEGAVRVLDVASAAVVGELRAPPGQSGVNITALTPDGAQLVTTGWIDDGAEVRDVATGALLRTIMPNAATAWAVDVSPDGRWLATAGLPPTAHIWSLPDGRLHGTLGVSASISNVDWSADSSRVVLAGDDGTARVFEVTEDDTREVARLASTVVRAVLGVAFSPDGEHVLLGDHGSQMAQVIDLAGAGGRQWLTAPVPADASGADFLADGSQLVASAVGGGLAVHDVESGRLLRTTGAPRGVVGEVRTSPDGSLVAAATADSVVVWDIATGTEVFAAPAAGVRSLSWSDDGELLAFVGAAARVRLVDRSGATVPSRPRGLDAADVTNAEVVSDGRLLVTSHARSYALGEGHVEVLDRVDARVTSRWDVPADRLAVSPDARLVAQAVTGGSVVVHDLVTGRRTRTLVGHVGQVQDLDFSPDGRLLATSGQDATTRLWDLRTGRQRLALRGHSSAVLTGRFSPDGSRLVTTGGDGTVRVWALDLDELVRIAQERATRTLTEDECRRYLQRACA